MSSHSHFNTINALVPRGLIDFSSVIASWTAGVLLNHHVRSYKKSKRNVKLALLLFSLNATTLLGPIYLPHKTLRFILSGTIFATFMVINNNIFNKFLSNKKEKTIQNDDDKLKDGNERSDSNGVITLYSSLKEALFYQSPTTRQSNSATSKSVFKWRRAVYFTYSFLFGDAILYLIVDWIPIYIIPAHQELARTLVKGVHIVYGMDFTYTFIILISSLFGASMPLSSHHRHPLLSCSLSELWGVRWNPVIMKALQACYYIPLMQVCSIRWVAMIGCFAGSAALHAYSTYLSTWSVYDSWLMGSFFLIHGALTTTEQILIHISGSNIKQYYKENLIVRAGQAETRARYQWLIETMISVTYIVGVLVQVESTLPTWEHIKQPLLGTIMIITITSYSIHTYTIVTYKYSTTKSTSQRVLITGVKTVGWLWTLGTTIDSLSYVVIFIIVYIYCRYFLFTCMTFCICIICILKYYMYA